MANSDNLRLKQAIATAQAKKPERRSIAKEGTVKRFLKRVLVMLRKTHGT
jgi:hypothetical protein